MKKRQAKSRPTTDVSAASMSDIAFLLLIFFMVTAAFTMQKSFQVPTPEESAPSTQYRESVDGGASEGGASGSSSDDEDAGPAGPTSGEAPR